LVDKSFNPIDILATLLHKDTALTPDKLSHHRGKYSPLGKLIRCVLNNTVC